MDKKEIEKRLSSGDIFLKCENKKECPNCKAIADGDNDKFCWRCGKKL